MNLILRKSARAIGTLRAHISRRCPLRRHEAVDIFEAFSFTATVSIFSYLLRILPVNTTEAQFIQYVSQANGFLEDIDYNRDYLKLLDDIFRKNNMTPTMVMSALIQPCEDLTIKCRWQMALVPCNEIFTKSLTYFGNCCTFNKNSQIE